MQHRLYKRQVDRLKAEKCSGAAILRYAYRRYLRGDFGNCGTICDNSANSKKVPQLEAYAVKQRFPVSDALLRQILDWHWSIPDEKFLQKCRDEIKRLDVEIGDMMQTITGVSYIQEN